MAKGHWEPLAGLTSLRREMDRLFEDFVRRPLHLGDLRVWEPAVEVADTKDTMEITMPRSEKAQAKEIAIQV